MAYDSSGNFRLDTRKLKVTMLMDIDVIADLNITPEEVMDCIRDGLKLKKLLLVRQRFTSETEEMDRSKLFSYFVEHKLKNLTEYIHEF